MGNQSSSFLSSEEIAKIKKETNFTCKQIQRLLFRFKSLDKNDCGSLSKEDFMRIPELAIIPLSERIVQSFFKESQANRINFQQFVKIIANFRPIDKETKNKLECKREKFKFVFSMFDLDNDGKISKEELLTVLRMLFGSYISEEQLTRIATRAIYKADTDKDNMVSFSEFCHVLNATGAVEKRSVKSLELPATSVQCSYNKTPSSLKFHWP